MYTKDYFEVKYKVRVTDNVHTVNFDDAREAYSFIGGIKRLCSDVKLIKHNILDNVIAI